MEREEKELEDEIKLAGYALLSSPSSVSQLLLLLEVIFFPFIISPLYSFSPVIFFFGVIKGVF
jgi:hypothetical protein